MFINHKPIILASASPRRKELLQRLGLHFSVQPAMIDEHILRDETPDDFAQRMAQEKAKSLAADNEDACTIGADTVVTLDDHIFGKPKDARDALFMLQTLQGKTHRVITGLAVVVPKHSMYHNETVVTEVCFSAFDKQTLQAYISTRESDDKAGAYGIQGIGSFLVRAINGSYTNVVGLPVNRLINILIENKIVSSYHPSLPCHQT